MHGMKKAFGAWLIGASLLISTSLASGQDGRVLTVATEGAYPPFNLQNAQGEPAGFEVDLIKALCEEMRATCSIVTEDWENLFGGLLRKQFDAVVSSVEITPERRKRFAFTSAYYRVPSAYLARKGEVSGPFSEAMLIGKTVAVVADSTQEMLLRRLFGEKVAIARYGSLEEAALDVGADRADFALLDKFELQKWLEPGKQASCCTMIADAPYDPAVSGEGFGIMVRKSERDLRDRFDAALRSLQTNGGYDAIRARYFPFDIR